MKGYLIPLLFVAALLVSGCGSSSAPMATPTATATPTPTEQAVAGAKNGDTVKVHYTGRLGNGTVFGSSVGGEPLQFTLGAGQVIPGFEQTVIGMQPGESKTVVIPADQAYGPYRDELVMVRDRDQLPPDWEPQVGNRFPLTQPDGQVIWATVIDVSESSITLDFNHHLAGKDLTFDITLVEIM